MAKDDAPEVQAAKAEANAEILSSMVHAFEGLGTEGIKLLEKVLETAHSSAGMAFTLGMILTHIASKTPNPFARDIIAFETIIEPPGPGETGGQPRKVERRMKPTLIDDATAGLIKTVLTTAMGVSLGGEVLEKIAGFIPLGGARSDDLMKPSTQVLVLGEGGEKALSTLLRKQQ